MTATAATETDTPEIEVHETVWIPMPDGTRLAARLWLPASARRTPLPCLLEYIPYRRRDRTRMRDESMHPHFAAAGYASIRVDIRGYGDSDGLSEDEYSDQETQDGHDVIAWLAEQDWCDGNVGMMGKSWSGFNSLQVAARRPPAAGSPAARRHRRPRSAHAVLRAGQAACR